MPHPLNSTESRAKAVEDPSLYRNVDNERVRAIIANRGSLQQPVPNPQRRLERARTLAARERMPLIELIRLICEYEAGELDYTEILQLFSTLIASEVISFMPFAFQHIALVLVVNGKIDAGGRLVEGEPSAQGM